MPNANGNTAKNISIKIKEQNIQNDKC